jgi:hypothetical protein
MWSHLGVCKKFSFVIDWKQKTLVLEPKPKIEGGENLVTVKAVSYNYEECRKPLEKLLYLMSYLLTL